MLYGVIAAVVIAVLVVVAVVLPSLGPGAPSTPSGAITYGQAAPGSNYSVRSFHGYTNWSLLFVAGLDPSTPTTTTAALGDLGVSNCTLAPSPGVSGNLTVPAFTGSLTSGHAPLWEFFYQNFSSQAVAIVAVENGTVTVLGTISSPECTDVFSIIDPIPAHVLDSPTIGAAVAANASAYLTAHPGASAVYGLIGPVFSSFPVENIPAKWVVEFSTCALSTNPSGVGSEYNATVNAATGAEIHAQSASSFACASDPPAAGALEPLHAVLDASRALRAPPSTR